MNNFDERLTLRTLFWTVCATVGCMILLDRASKWLRWFLEGPSDLPRVGYRSDEEYDELNDAYAAQGNRIEGAIARVREYREKLKHVGEPATTYTEIGDWFSHVERVLTESKTSA